MHKCQSTCRKSHFLSHLVLRNAIMANLRRSISTYYFNAFLFEGALKGFYWEACPVHLLFTNKHCVGANYNRFIEFSMKTQAKCKLRAIGSRMEKCPPRVVLLFSALYTACPYNFFRVMPYGCTYRMCCMEKLYWLSRCCPG